MTQVQIGVEILQQVRAMLNSPVLVEVDPHARIIERGYHSRKWRAMRQIGV